MDLLIKGVEMPTYEQGDLVLRIRWDGRVDKDYSGNTIATAVPVPPHGDLIDRDALIKDGWLNLHKEVVRMGGYAIHELPLKNPSIPVIIPADLAEESEA